jgi:CHASE2 domain-containing sensor protein
MIIAEHIGWLDRFETAGIDVFNILQTPRDPSHVVVIGITEDDYKNLFSETSPLDYKRLNEIIYALAIARPQVIGVDLDTASDEFRHLSIPEDSPPIVWGQDLDRNSVPARPLPVLGGDQIRLLRSLDATGVALMPEDTDGVIRRYHPQLTFRGDTFKSFALAVVEACSRRLNRNCSKIETSQNDAPQKGFLLNFSGDRFNFTPLSVSHVLAIANKPGWKEKSPLTGKIVLLGGFYQAGRDTHITPVGEMTGVQIMAQAVETELSGGGIRPLHELNAFGLDILVGILLVVLHRLFSLRLALLLNLAAIPILSLVASYVVFSSFSRWLNFAPLVVGVLIHELYHQARDYERVLHAQE